MLCLKKMLLSKYWIWEIQNGEWDKCIKVVEEELTTKELKRLVDEEKHPNSDSDSDIEVNAE